MLLASAAADAAHSVLVVCHVGLRHRGEVKHVDEVRLRMDRCTGMCTEMCIATCLGMCLDMSAA